eukprot:31442-Pelagococcus_subviridis.AAC.8
MNAGFATASAHSAAPSGPIRASTPSGPLSRLYHTSSRLSVDLRSSPPPPVVSVPGKDALTSALISSIARFHRSAKSRISGAAAAGVSSASPAADSPAPAAAPAAASARSTNDIIPPNRSRSVSSTYSPLKRASSAVKYPYAALSIGSATAPPVTDAIGDVSAMAARTRSKLFTRNATPRLLLRNRAEARVKKSITAVRSRSIALSICVSTTSPAPELIDVIARVRSAYRRAT